MSQQFIVLGTGDEVDVEDMAEPVIVGIGDTYFFVATDGVDCIQAWTDGKPYGRSTGDGTYSEADIRHSCTFNGNLYVTASSTLPIPP
jgi:hypothetical protein